MIICSPQYGLAPHSNAGGEVYDEQVLKGLADNGHIIEIILPFGKPYDKKQKNWNVERLPLPYMHMSYLFNLAILPWLVRTHRRTKFNILRVHSPYYVGIGAFLFKTFFAPEVKLAVSYLHLEKNIIFRLIDRMLIAQWDFITTISLATLGDLKKVYGIPEQKIVLAYPGISKLCVPGEKNKTILNTYGLKDKFVVSFCGLLIKRKNVSFLLEVLAVMDDTEIVLVIIGDGPERESLKERAKELKLHNRVVFTGYVKEGEKVAILQSSDLFLFPSLMEGFGLAPAEAMSCGIPSIVSTKGSLPETIGSGGVALELDRRAWAKQIKEIKNNEEYRKDLSAKALSSSEIYTWKSAVNKIEEAMEKLTSN